MRQKKGRKGAGIAGLALATLLGVGATLAGCEKEYTYVPPPTAEGRQCIQQCQLAQGACHDDQARGAAFARQQCEASADARQNQCAANAQVRYDRCQELSSTEYTACLRYAPDRKSCVQKACVLDACPRQGCYQSADYAACDTVYRACFQGCGGVVGIMK